MKKTKYDRVQDFLLFFIKPLVFPWMYLDAKRIVKSNGFNFKRKDPYLMLANHTFLLDVVHVPLKLKNNPFIVASEELFVRQPTKFLFKWVAHVIPKSKGASDLRTAKGIIGAIKRGYPVLIFPEGDTTFYGETKNIEFSTMKLIKKLKVDVVTCNVKGGYLSKPRWAEGKRKKRVVELNYNVTIKKEELAKMNLDMIYDVISKALYNNDYEYQRKHMIKHPGFELAKGLENILYICPECDAVNSLETAGNFIRCNHCKVEGKINEYGFIEGFRFDNTIDWDDYQRTKKDLLLNSKINSTGDLYFIRFDDSIKELVGKVNIQYKDLNYHISGDYEEIIPVDEVTKQMISLRRDFTFIYNEKYYHFKLDRYASSLLRVTQDKY